MDRLNPCGLPHPVGGGGIEGIARVAGDEKDKSDEAHQVERSIALLFVSH